MAFDEDPISRLLAPLMQVHRLQGINTLRTVLVPLIAVIWWLFS